MSSEEMAAGPGESAGVKVEVKFARLIKWPNKADGEPDYERGPDEILIKTGDEEPFRSIYVRGEH